MGSTMHAERRQWGADKRTAPMQPVAVPAGDALITLGRVGIVLTLLAPTNAISPPKAPRTFQPATLMPRVSRS